MVLMATCPVQTERGRRIKAELAKDTPAAPGPATLVLDADF